MKKYASIIITIILVLFAFSTLWIFPSDFTTEYIPQVRFEARSHVESMDCTGFGDVIQAKFEKEQEKYEWLDFEAFANDYDYIAELSIVWDFQTCYAGQTEDVKMFIYRSLQ